MARAARVFEPGTQEHDRSVLGTAVVRAALMVNNLSGDGFITKSFLRSLLRDGLGNHEREVNLEADLALLIALTNDVIATLPPERRRPRRTIAAVIRQTRDLESVLVGPN